MSTAMRSFKKVGFQIIFCFLVICFLRDRFLQSGVPVEKRTGAAWDKREVNLTLVQPGPECLRHRSDTNHQANIARIQRAVEGWVRRVDPHNYTYLINPSKKCEKQAGDRGDLLLVIFVNSAPDHFVKRSFIRNTSGKQFSWPMVLSSNQSVRLVFSLGAVDDKLLQTQIDEESTIFGDIVQESFVDDYMNMTLKTVMGLKWTTTYCKRAAYVMKIDDDVMINTPKISDILLKAPNKRFTMGDLHAHPIVRDPLSEWGKFYTPKHLWPSKKFPPFFTGPAYIFSMDVAEKVYRASLETPLFPWSDVFVGMSSLKANVFLKNQPQFISIVYGAEDKPLPTRPKDLTHYRNLHTIFHTRPLHMVQLWKIWTNSTVTL